MQKAGKTDLEIEVKEGNYVDRRYTIYDERRSLFDSETDVTATMVARVLHNKGMASQAGLVPGF